MTPKTKQNEPSELWRLAEIIQMRRVDNYGVPNMRSYLECCLCLGKSDASGEIQHKDDCPIERMKEK